VDALEGVCRLWMRLQFVARPLAVNYKVIRQRREAGSVKQDVRSPLAIVIQLYGHSSYFLNFNE